MTHEARWDHHTSWMLCPHCGALHDGAANMTGDNAPSEGDFNLCFECGDWAVFTADGQRRKPIDAELTILATEPELIEMTRRYWEFRAMHPERWPRT